MAARALITGASGLIGRHLLEEWSLDDLRPEPLPRGHDLLVPGTAQEVVSSREPSVVVHLAWCSSGTPGYRHHPDNARWVDASIELRDACLGHRIPFVAMGTVVDGDPGRDDYSRSKAALRQRLARAIDDAAVTWLRPHYVFDPVGGRPALVAEGVAARQQGRPAVLRSPDARHDFIHVVDVARAIVTALGHRLTGSVDIGSGRTRRARDLVERLGAPWVASPGADDGVQHDEHAADVTRLREAGWTPTATEVFFGDG